jgi:hypothetical protein
MQENPSFLNDENPVLALLRKTMMSTHIFPQHYTINHIRYDPVPIVEGDSGKVFKGRDLGVCVSVVARPGDVSVRFTQRTRIIGTTFNSVYTRSLLIS